MERSLSSLGTNIQDTRGQLVETREGYDSIVTHIQEMFQNLELINKVLSELGSFVRERSGELTTVMHDLEVLKRIG